MTESQSRFEWFLFDWQHSAVVAGSAIVLLMILFFYLSGSLTGEPPWYFDSVREFQGMLLMMVLMPAYFGFVFIKGWRRSLELAREIDNTYKTGLTQAALTVPPGVLLIGAVVGFMFAILFNIPGYALNFFSTDSIERSTITGQLLIWTSATALVGFRIRLAFAFNRTSEKVDIDIFETSHLKPFAQIGLIDVLVIVGALVISTLQSLDFSFRPDNYINALTFAIPTLIFMSIYPMHRLHRRMLSIKKSQLDEVNQLIAAAPKDLASEHVQKLEMLLQRRERIEDAATWPIDISIVQRFLFYIVIPPLAWVGAALVEFAIDSFIQS